MFPELKVTVALTQKTRVLIFFAILRNLKVFTTTTQKKFSPSKQNQKNLFLLYLTMMLYLRCLINIK
jgi:hypothetical protein